MYKRKSLKLISLLLTLCFLLTAFSGSAIRAQAEELGINNTITASSSNDLEQWALINLYIGMKSVSLAFCPIIRKLWFYGLILTVFIVSISMGNTIIHDIVRLRVRQSVRQR